MIKKIRCIYNSKLSYACMIKRGQLCISYLTLQLERIKLILKLLTHVVQEI